MKADDNFIALARAAAARHSLDPALVCAICEQESGWIPWASRYEPVFRAHYVAPLGLGPTEEITRSISWGLMQVMGQVARESGFSGRFLSELCDPAAGLDVGCTVLVRKFAESDGDFTRTLLRWNGGANPDYPPQVLARMQRYAEPAPENQFATPPNP